MARRVANEKQESQLILEPTQSTEQDQPRSDFLRQHPDFASVHWLLFPDDIAKAYWDLVMFFLLMISAVTEPYKLAVVEDSDLQAVGWKVLDWLILSCFWMDLLSNFFTAYFDQQTLVVNKYRIAKHYLRTWFVVDFLSCFPFDSLVELSGAPTKLAKLARLPRLYRLVKSSK
jgi:hypothetical protein